MNSILGEEKIVGLNSASSLLTQVQLPRIPLLCRERFL